MSGMSIMKVIKGRSVEAQPADSSIRMADPY